MIQQKNIMLKILVYINFKLMLFFQTISFLLPYQVKLLNHLK